MNERKDSSAGETAAAELEPTVTDEPGSSGADRSARPSGARQGLTLTALVAALAALGLTGWLWWQQFAAGESSRFDALIAEVDARAGEIQRMQTQVEAQGRHAEEIQGRIENRLQELEDRPPAIDRSQLQNLDERNERIEARLNTLERDVSSQINALDARLEAQPDQPETDFDEQIRQHRRELVLHETAALLRIGQSLAELGDDPTGARQAYAQAAARLSTLDDRRAASLRQAVVREAELLAAVSGPDWVEMVGQLAALSASAADWPLIDNQPDTNGEALQAETDDSDGWLGRVGRTLGGLVKVTPREQTVLPESVVESLRERVKLYLAAAEAAAARRNAAELAQHARAAMELLDSRFNALDPAVARARELLAGFARNTIAEQRPDLGAALAEIERSLEVR